LLAWLLDWPPVLLHVLRLRVAMDCGLLGCASAGVGRGWLAGGLLLHVGVVYIQATLTIPFIVGMVTSIAT